VPATSEKRVEIWTVAKDDAEQKDSPDSLENGIRHRIARRAAKEIKDGYYVNLGIGMPTLVPEYLDPSVKVWLQSENGILGMGPYPHKDKVDP
jgi:3-oxoacid CoA-transferase